MIEVKRIPNDSYCTICDAEATMEISHDGGLKLFWACGPHDREITLCESCARELKDKLNAIIK